MTEAGRSAARSIAPAGRSQPRIDRFALERENTKDALVHAAQRLASHESLERFDAERELTQRG